MRDGKLCMQYNLTICVVPKRSSPYGSTLGTRSATAKPSKACKRDACGRSFSAASETCRFHLVKTFAIWYYGNGVKHIRAKGTS